MRDFINKISLFNVTALGSAFLVPISCVVLNKDSFLTVLNFFFLAHALAIVFDAFVLVRTESFFARAKPARSIRMLKSAVDVYGAAVVLVLVFAAVEFYYLGFSFLLVALARHIFNFSKVCVPQIDALYSMSYRANAVAVARNTLILISILMLETEEALSIAIATVSLAEIFGLWVAMSKECNRNVEFPLRRLVDNMRCRISKVFVDKSARVGMANAVMGSVDRVVIAAFFPDAFQVLFLKYKLLSQYIDGFFSIFSYQLRLEIIKQRAIWEGKKYILPGLSMISVGVFLALVTFDIETVYSFVVIFVLVAVLVLKRMLDGVLGSYFISLRHYNFVAFKSVFESFVIFFVVLSAGYMFSEDVDKVFFVYASSIFLCSLIFLIKKIRCQNA